MSTETRQNITISMDGTWAGDGKLRDGVIEDCGAQFCDDNDASLDVYDEIESAILEGKSQIKIEIEGETKLIEWSITESDDGHVYDVENACGATTRATTAQSVALKSQDLSWRAAMDLPRGVRVAKPRIAIDGVTKAYRTKR